MLPRFALEIVAAVTKEVGAGKVGIRLGAHGLFLSPPDSTPYATYTYLLEKLNGLPAPLAYVHFMESRIVGELEISCCVAFWFLSTCLISYIPLHPTQRSSRIVGGLESDATWIPVAPGLL